MVRILAALSLLLPVWGQGDTDREQTFRTTVNVVVAPTTVTDSRGRYVNGLQPHEFRVLDKGQVQDIRVDVAFQPISLVVAIQANASTTDVLPKVQKIGSLLSTLILGERGQAAIVCFDHRIQVLQDFTADSDRINAALARLRPGSTSNRIIDAVNQSVHLLRRRPQQHRRVVLLISETRDLGSEGRLRETLAFAEFQNVSVYTVNINRLVSTLTTQAPPPRPSPIPPEARPMPGGSARTPENQMAYTGYGSNTIPLFVEIFRDIKAIFISNPAEVLTRFTGGREFSFVTQKALESAISEIGEELYSQYMISYNPKNKEEGGFHEIQVMVPGRPELKVRHRPGYWLAAVPQ